MSTVTTKGLALFAIIAVLVLGATQLSKGSTTTAAAARGGFGGGPPPGMAGFGAPVSGATLAKLTRVATARYAGTVEQAMQLQDGSYVVRVIARSGTETHVLVSKAFAITGTAQGPPPGLRGQNAPPPGVVPRNGTPPTLAPGTTTSTS